jgi:hypothetical protein
VLGWGSRDEDLQESVVALNAYILRFQTIPIELRRFLGAVARRAWKMRESKVVRTGGIHGTVIHTSDIVRALALDSSTLMSNLSALESYSVMGLYELEISFRPEPAIQINTLRGGWDLWMDVVEFSEKAGIPLEAFTEDLDFGRLDA